MDKHVLINFEQLNQSCKNPSRFGRSFWSNLQTWLLLRHLKSHQKRNQSIQKSVIDISTSQQWPTTPDLKREHVLSNDIICCSMLSYVSMCQRLPAYFHNAIIQRVKRTWEKRKFQWNCRKFRTVLKRRTGVEATKKITKWTITHFRCFWETF